MISLVLEPVDDADLPEVRPGQYVSVFVDLPGGDRQPRQYTVSSTAFGTRLQITVRRVTGVNGAPDGRVSCYLHDNVRVGDVLDVSAPAGDFVVDPSDGPLLLASAGAGITTVLPIVEHIARNQPERTVIVAHADRTAQDHALRDTVLHVARHIDNFTAYTWYETVDPADQRSRQGFMDLSHDIAARELAGFHLRSASVHAARQVNTAGQGRTAVQHPVRGLRPGPVGRPGREQPPDRLTHGLPGGGTCRVIFHG